jgi:transcriptional regulator with XRE-family HTH domain
MREWLRARRVELNLSEKAVANAVGIKQAPYHRIETGQSNPKVENAKKIARLLGVEWQLFYPDDQKAG